MKVKEIFKDKQVALKNYPQEYDAYGRMRFLEDIEIKFEQIYLIRNERAFKIFNYKGERFEPDFVLFCKQKTGEALTYQVFIEPKGDHLLEHDKWKNELLKLIRDEKKKFEFETDKYLITAVPFYNERN